MATPPDRVRAALVVAAADAAAEVRAVAEQSQTPTEARAALFAAAPLVVASFYDGSAALALEWYEELREESRPRRTFRPRIVSAPDPDVVAAEVAKATRPLHDLIEGRTRDIEEAARELESTLLQRAIDESLIALEPSIEREVAEGFRETITENVEADPDAVGWKRHARPEACKFCKMLADRGAVYTSETARFAAHGAVTDGKVTGGNCMCIAGPAFGGKEIWAEATPMQYLASKRQWTPEQRARVREYLNENYPDAHG